LSDQTILIDNIMKRKEIFNKKFVIGF